MKRKIAILIRVYDRIEDLKYNLEIIENTWLGFEYNIIVVSNGNSDGYEIDNKITEHTTVVVLDDNVGHKKGNAQLLLEGIKYIPLDCDYTIILEADTWMYTDKIIFKYIDLMDTDPKLVWASADWYDKDFALAVDFAIIKSSFIRSNEKLFDFEDYPETYISNYLRDSGVSFVWIKENMPVHVPSYITKYPYVNDSKNKRFYVFPKAKMITHHIEFLEGGMTQKKRYFNIISDSNFFSGLDIKNKKWERFKMYFWTIFSEFFIKKSWFKKKYYRNIS